jgi:hypothetical protein
MLTSEHVHRLELCREKEDSATLYYVNSFVLGKEVNSYSAISWKTVLLACIMAWKLYYPG